MSMLVAEARLATGDLPGSEGLSINDSQGSSVKTALTARRTRRVVETREFAAFARRIVRAFSRRVADGDVDALPDLVAFSRDVDAAIASAVLGLRDFGYGWAEIGDRLGVSKQAAQQRWGNPSRTPEAGQGFLPTLGGEVIGDVVRANQ